MQTLPPLYRSTSVFSSAPTHANRPCLCTYEDTTKSPKIRRMEDLSNKHGTSLAICPMSLLYLALEATNALPK